LFQDPQEQLVLQVQLLHLFAALPQVLLPDQSLPLSPPHSLPEPTGRESSNHQFSHGPEEDHSLPPE
jgi:hypothetical protein